MRAWLRKNEVEKDFYEGLHTNKTNLTGTTKGGWKVMTTTTKVSSSSNNNNKKKKTRDDDGLKASTVEEEKKAKKNDCSTSRNSFPLTIRKQPSGEYFWLQCQPTYRISTLQQKIHKMRGIPLGNIRLVLPSSLYNVDVNDNDTDNDKEATAFQQRTLKSLGINDNNNNKKLLELASISLVVRTPKGKTMFLKDVVDAECNIDEIERLILEELVRRNNTEGLVGNNNDKRKRIQLYYDQFPLQRGHPITKYKIKHKGIIELKFVEEKEISQPKKIVRPPSSTITTAPKNQNTIRKIRPKTAVAAKTAIIHPSKIEIKSEEKISPDVVPRKNKSVIRRKTMVVEAKDATMTAAKLSHDTPTEAAATPKTIKPKMKLKKKKNNNNNNNNLMLSPSSFAIDNKSPVVKIAKIVSQKDNDNKDSPPTSVMDTTVPDCWINLKGLMEDKTDAPIAKMEEKKENERQHNVAPPKSTITVNAPNGRIFTVVIDDDDDEGGSNNTRKKIAREAGMLLRDLRLSRAIDNDHYHKELDTDFVPSHGDILSIMPPSITIKVPTTMKNTGDQEGGTFTLDVLPTDTAENVREKIATRAGIPIQELRLVKGSAKEELDEIFMPSHGDELRIKPRRVTIKTPLDGAVFQVDIDPDDTTKDIRRKVAEETGMSFEDIRLVMGDNSTAIEDISIPKHGDIYTIEGPFSTSAAAMKLLNETNLDICAAVPTPPTTTIADIRESIEERIARTKSKEEEASDAAKSNTETKKKIDGKAAVAAAKSILAKIKNKAEEEGTVTVAKDGTGAKSKAEAQDRKKKDEETVAFAKVKIEIETKKKIEEGAAFSKAKAAAKAKKVEEEEEKMRMHAEAKEEAQEEEIMRLEAKAKKYAEEEEQIRMREAEIIATEWFEKERLELERLELERIEQERQQQATSEKLKLNIEDDEVGPMIITVNTPDKTAFEVEILLQDTAKAVWQNIATKVNIPIEDIRLSINGKEMDRSLIPSSGDILDVVISKVTVIVDGEEVELEAFHDTVIGDIKDALQEKTGMHHTNQVLFLLENNEILDDDMPIKNDVKLRLESFIISVLCWSGDIVELCGISSKTSVDEIKERLAQEKSVPKEKLTLSKGGSLLAEDQKVLSNYGVKHRDILMLANPEKPDVKKQPVSFFRRAKGYFSNTASRGHVEVEVKADEGNTEKAKEEQIELPEENQHQPSSPSASSSSECDSDEKYCIVTEEECIAVADGGVESLPQSTSAIIPSFSNDYPEDDRDNDDDDDDDNDNDNGNDNDNDNDDDDEDEDEDNSSFKCSPNEWSENFDESDSDYNSDDDDEVEDNEVNTIIVITPDLTPITVTISLDTTTTRDVKINISQITDIPINALRLCMHDGSIPIPDDFQLSPGDILTVQLPAIIVTLPDHSTLELSIPPNNSTIDDVKNYLEEKTGTIKSNQLLYFMEDANKEHELDDTMPIETDCNIQMDIIIKGGDSDDDILVVEEEVLDPVVTITLPHDDEIIELEASPGTLIGDIKEILADETGISKSNQKLLSMVDYSGGKELNQYDDDMPITKDMDLKLLDLSNSRVPTDDEDSAHMEDDSASIDDESDCHVDTDANIGTASSDVDENSDGIVVLENRALEALRRVTTVTAKNERRRQQDKASDTTSKATAAAATTTATKEEKNIDDLIAKIRERSEARKRAKRMKQ